jgi:hypothetical protein
MAFNEVLAGISNATQRPLQFLTISSSEYAEGMKQYELPESVSNLVI